MKLLSLMVQQIIAQAEFERPNECCGIILSHNGVATKLRPARNAEPSPTSYVIHPLDLLQIETEAEINGDQIFVIYHSHLTGEAYPSPTDIRLSRWPGDPQHDMYPGAYYVIVSLATLGRPVVRAFRIRNGRVSEEEIEII